MTTDPNPVPDAGGPFGVESFEQDDRLRLFAFTTAERSRQYLWALRAMERSRANYVVLLHAGEVANSLRELRAEHGTQVDVPSLTMEELSLLLDQLFFWGLLERSYDGARAASLAGPGTLVPVRPGAATPWFSAAASGQVRQGSVVRTMFDFQPSVRMLRLPRPG